MQRIDFQPPGRTSSVKTGSLQQTDSYIWNTADALGRGATAVVYFGRHKETGDVCAVKVFHRGWRSCSTSQQREIGALRSVQHESIVKFLALEKEIASGNEVLVMEYCSGGSVFTMLEQPQYAHGFPLVEFRLFLLHLAEGMSYLRMRGYIHRDIKPGNIMRAIGEDGRSQYKITDFGAARPLDDDETFMSIYGTEEYLFPGMYERAVLRQPGPGNQEFDASVDIWSLGVTIFHVCTGQLPFRPFGGRSNTSAMHTITSTKPPGAISGVQESDHGIIKWSKRLPEKCRLPDSLKAILVRMLAGLMETNPSEMWTFDRFFRTVTELENMVTVKVFVANSGKLLHLHINKSARWTNIQALIASECHHHVEDQLILCREREVQLLIDQSACMHTYPKYLLNEIWTLMNQQTTEDSMVMPLTTLEFPAIGMSENLDLDAQTSRQCAGVAHQHKEDIIWVLDVQSLYRKAELHYRQFVKLVVRDFDVTLPLLELTLQETRKRQLGFKSAFKVVMTLFNTITYLTNTGALTFSKSETKTRLMEFIQQLDSFLEDDSLERFFHKIEVRMNEIRVYVEVLSRKIQEQESERLKLAAGCLVEDYCLSKAENLQSKISSIASTMTKHKKYKDLHSHEQFIHKCEKEKLQEYCVSMSSLVNDHCAKNTLHCHKHTMKEIGNLTKHLVRTKKVEQNVAAVKESMTQLSSKLELEERQCKLFVEKISNLLASTLIQGTCQPEETSTSANNQPPPQSLTVPVLETVDISRTPEGAETSTHVDETSKYANVDETSKYANVDETSKYADAKEKSTLAGVRQQLQTCSMVDDESCSQPKSQRSLLLDKLTQELFSLQKDSEELRKLVNENSVVMKKFLSETSNLKVDGSLDSDTRMYTQENTKQTFNRVAP